jgi:hypothetical protein
MPSIFEGNEGNEGNIGNAGNAFAVTGGWYFADRINLPLVTEFDTGPNATPANTIGKLRNNQRHYLDRNWAADWYAWLALNDFVTTGWSTINPSAPPPGAPNSVTGNNWFWPSWVPPSPMPSVDWSGLIANVTPEIDQLVTDASNERADALGEILSQANEFISYFLNMMTARPSSHPNTTRVLNIASLVALFVSMYYKGQYQRPRPSQLCPALLPPIAVPGHASFPSGHSTQAHLMALCMGDVLSVLPQQDQKNMADDLWTLADCIAHNREIAGLHYPSDTAGGKAYAYWIHYLINNASQTHYNQAVTAAQAEWPNGEWQ